jgi:hypothetical protein
MYAIQLAPPSRVSSKTLQHWPGRPAPLLQRRLTFCRAHAWPRRTHLLIEGLLEVPNARADRPRDGLLTGDADHL